MAAQNVSMAMWIASKTSQGDVQVASFLESVASGRETTKKKRGSPENGMRTAERHVFSCFFMSFDCFSRFFRGVQWRAACESAGLLWRMMGR